MNWFTLTERVCYGLELDPNYVDVVVERWQGLTGRKSYAGRRRPHLWSREAEPSVQCCGKKATLEGDGRTFDAAQQDRMKLAA